MDRAFQREHIRKMLRKTLEVFRRSDGGVSNVATAFGASCVLCWLHQ